MILPEHERPKMAGADRTRLLIPAAEVTHNTLLLAFTAAAST